MKKSVVRAMISSVAATALVAPVLMFTATASVEAASADAPQRAVAKTKVTYKIANCEGCEVSVGSYQDDGQGGQKFWNGPQKSVQDGSVSFRVPTAYTPGLSTSIRAPWEGQTGYVTQVVMRYKGEDPGTRISSPVARSKSRGTSCWAGTTKDAVTITVVARKVRVGGVHHRVDGTLAFARVTQEWVPWMQRAPKGVLGAQDLPPCRVA